jgi:hypothetical protein
MSRKLSIALVAAALACTTFATTAQTSAAQPKTRAQANTAWGEEGLEKRTIKGLDAVYARPGATLAAYKKVRLGPITVAFRKNWDRQVPGTMRVRADQQQRIKDQLAGLIRDEMTKQLKQGGYEVVTAPGADVLDVNLSIVDLYVTAPDLPTAGRVDVYAISAGEMTMIAELRDAASNDLVMRVYDHAEADESFRPKRITNIDNKQEARAAAAAWAKILRTQLDTARGVQGGKR